MGILHSDMLETFSLLSFPMFEFERVKTW